MWRKPHLSAVASRFIFLLRIASLLAVTYGFVAQMSEPLFQKLNAGRFGGAFQFLTIITAVLTIGVMAFGLFCTVCRKFQSLHMHMVVILIPAEFIVTAFSWTMYIFFRDGILSPEAIEAGYLEFNALIHYCLHLMPLVGLVLDFVTELDFYVYRRWQGVTIAVLGAAYFGWLVFLYIMNDGRWVYHCMTHMSWWQIGLTSSGAVIAALLCWRLLVALYRYIFKERLIEGRRAEMLSVV